MSRLQELRIPVGSFDSKNSFMRRVAGTIMSRIKFVCPARKKDDISLYKRNVLAPQPRILLRHVYFLARIRLYPVYTSCSRRVGGAKATM